MGTRTAPTTHALVSPGLIENHEAVGLHGVKAGVGVTRLHQTRGHSNPSDEPTAGHCSASGRLRSSLDSVGERTVTAMKSSDNSGLVHRLIDAWNAHDLDGLVEGYTDPLVVRSRRSG